MKTNRLIIIFLIIFSFSGFNQLNAQIGNLKNLKNKSSKLIKKNKKTDKETSSNTSNTKPSANSYAQFMKEGDKFNSEKKYIEALSAYNNALKAKPGDYSAKSKVDQAESNLKDFYMDKISKEIENNNCEQAEKDLSAAVEALGGSWYQADYYTKQINKCKENALANASDADKKAKIDALANGSANFYSDYGKKNFSNTLSIGDNLFVKLKFAKVMTEYFSEFGIEPAYSAYGFFNVYINGKKVFTDGPYHFSSNYSKVWTDFDVPLSTSPEFLKTFQQNPGLLSSDQDVWVLQQISNPQGISSKFTIAAIQNFKNGNNTVKIEFGLGEKSDKAPKGIIAKGEATISMDAQSKKELYKRGPKYLRPLEENEKGNFTFNNKNFIIGNGNLSMSLNLPQAPKYYNMKWCKSNSCDYDHGELMFEVELDGKYLASWTTTFWDADYESKKSFSSIIFPTNDNNLNNDLSDFNQSDFFKKAGMHNPIVYALFDLIYANKLTQGKHTLSVKVISPESIPPGLTYEASKNYYDKIVNAIAHNTLNFTVGSSSRTKLIASSSAHKLKHAGGSWTSIDTHLKASSTEGLATLIDVATYTQWKVTVNSLGTPLYRTCSANVIYKSKDGFTRLVRAVGVKEDYQGNGKYSKAYFTDLMNNYYTANPGFLNSMHYPVPYSKVK